MDSLIEQIEANLPSKLEILRSDEQETFEASKNIKTKFFTRFKFYLRTCGTRSMLENTTIQFLRQTLNKLVESECDVLSGAYMNQLKSIK